MKNPLERLLLQTPSAHHWQKVGIKNHHGIALPLFSLHSKKSCGIGEFFDLLPLIEWCHSIGFDIIQLLPLNDTGLDSSPYSAISAYALNFLHLSLWALKDVEKVPNFQEKFAEMQYWCRTLRVKYQVVRELKISFLKDYFDLFYDDISQQSGYQEFIKKNFWLDDYALFRALKDQELWQDWQHWPSIYKVLSKEQRQELLVKKSNKVNFYKFLQYLTFSQMHEVKQIANSKGLYLKGDLPILTSRDSADVWSNPHLFSLQYAAGAPPDIFTTEGQYWGFPIYNWNKMESNDFAWWRKRVHLLESIYHLYRVDHIVGFFRIWAIPFEKPASMGHFIPENDSVAVVAGKRYLEILLQSCQLLPIGEDLGFVPPHFKQVMYDLGISGTKVLRWERDHLPEGKYTPLDQYSPLSMSTLSTHDSDTLQLWWRHYPNEAKSYCEFKKWDYLPFLTPERHEEMLYDSHHSSSLFHINLLQEYLALFPELTSPNSNDERINVPGTISERNWTYRFRVPVEEIISHQGLKELMIRLLIN